MRVFKHKDADQHWSRTMSTVYERSFGDPATSTPMQNAPMYRFQGPRVLKCCKLRRETRRQHKPRLPLYKLRIEILQSDVASLLQHLMYREHLYRRSASWPLLAKANDAVLHNSLSDRLLDMHVTWSLRLTVTQGQCLFACLGRHVATGVGGQSIVARVGL